MSKIFLSHSKQDEESKNLFFRGFSGSGIGCILKEYETTSPPGSLPGQINRNMAEQIENDIMMSFAIFVVLSRTVQALPNTTHWIVWECGQGKAKKKLIWIFEPFETFGEITITIPHFTHYVHFQADDYWQRFIRRVAASYDDKPVIATGGGLAGLWMIGGLLGAIIGGVAGYLLSNKIECPKGFSVTCDGCFLSYEVYLPGGKGNFRCANCNKMWSIT